MKPLLMRGFPLSGQSASDPLEALGHFYSHQAAFSAAGPGPLDASVVAADGVSRLRIKSSESLSFSGSRAI